MDETLQLRIILPSDALARKLEQGLPAEARSEREPAQMMALETIVVLVSIAASLAGIAATRAQTEATKAQIEATKAQAEATRMEMLKTMLEIRQQLQQQGKAEAARIGVASGQLRSFADADESFLRDLLGLPAA